MKNIGCMIILLLTMKQSIVAQEFENQIVTASTFVSSSFIDDEEGWLADNNGSIWHTKNGGETWDSISVQKYFLRLDFADALNGFALDTAHSVYKTTDGGYTWSVLVLPGYVGDVLYFLDNLTGFIGGYQMIFKTTDGGATWIAIYTEDVSFLDLCFINPLVGTAVAYDEGFYRLVWRTTDGGLTWKIVFNERNYFMSSVWFLNENTGWAAGYRDRAGLIEPAILKTTDGGLTWKENYRNQNIDGRGEAFLDIRFKNEMEGYALSVHNYDIYTSDGGVTWNLAHDTDTLGLPPLYGMYKTLDGYSDIYLVGKSGNVATWK